MEVEEMTRMTCAESLAAAVPRELHIAGVVTLCVVVWTNAHAATPAASLGCDFRRGAEGQETRAATAAGTLGFGSGDLLLGAMRYDDSVVGPGSAVIVGGGLALQAPLAMRVVGTRFVGDEGYRGWRLK